MSIRSLVFVMDDLRGYDLLTGLKEAVFSDQSNRENYS